MILAVDAGNTAVTLGCVESREILNLARLAASPGRSADEYAVLMERVLSLRGVKLREFEGAAIASVVPPLTEVLREAVRLITGHDALVVGAGVKTGLNIGIDDPSQMGADLVAGAVAALDAHEPPVIIIDMGTATTITVIGPNSRLLGGAILPGAAVSLEALSGAASLLPRISLEAPKRVIGSGTIECMKSGAVFGAACAIDGMIDRMEAELGGSAAVVATGGLAERIIPYCTHDIELDDYMLLRGLSLIWQRNRRERRREAKQAPHA